VVAFATHLEHSANFSIDPSQVPNCLSLFKSASSRAGVSNGRCGRPWDRLPRPCPLQGHRMPLHSVPSPIIFTQHPQTSNARWKFSLVAKCKSQSRRCIIPPPLPQWGGRDAGITEPKQPNLWTAQPSGALLDTANDAELIRSPATSMSFRMGHTLRMLVTGKYP